MVRMIPNSQCCSIGFGPVQMLGGPALGFCTRGGRWSRGQVMQGLGRVQPCASRGRGADGGKWFVPPWASCCKALAASWSKGSTEHFSSGRGVFINTGICRSFPSLCRGGDENQETVAWPGQNASAGMCCGCSSSCRAHCVPTSTASCTARPSTAASTPLFPSQAPAQLCSPTKEQPCSPTAQPLHVHENGLQESNQQRTNLHLSTQNTFHIPPEAPRRGTSESGEPILYRGLHFFPSLSLESQHEPWEGATREAPALWEHRGCPSQHSARWFHLCIPTVQDVRAPPAPPRHTPPAQGSPWEMPSQEGSHSPHGGSHSHQRMGAEDGEPCRAPVNSSTSPALRGEEGGVLRDLLFCCRTKSSTDNSLFTCPKSACLRRLERESGTARLCFGFLWLS